MNPVILMLISYGSTREHPIYSVSWERSSRKNFFDPSMYKKLAFAEPLNVEARMVGWSDNMSCLWGMYIWCLQNFRIFEPPPPLSLSHSRNLSVLLSAFGVTPPLPSVQRSYVHCPYVYETQLKPSESTRLWGVSQSSWHIYLIWESVHFLIPR